VVVEELPELENIKTCLAESEIKKASNLNDEWNLSVYLSNDHPKIVVVLQN